MMKQLIWERAPKSYVMELNDNDDIEKELAGYDIIEKAGNVYIIQEKQ